MTMLDTIIVFVTGLMCGLTLGVVNRRLQQKKIKFYETYIYRRLRESVPRVGDDLNAG